MEPNDDVFAPVDPRSPARIALDNFLGIFKLGAPRGGSVKRDVHVAGKTKSGLSARRRKNRMGSSCLFAAKQ